jgi:thiol-disulfide isomerase/thioredoxin
MNKSISASSLRFDVHVSLQAQDAVWTLSSSNFTEALQYSPVSLVMVYVHANWCGYCKDLTPEYRYAALLLLAMKAPVRQPHCISPY